MTTTVINIKNTPGFPRDKNDVYIGRNMMWTKYKLTESKWHNPFLVDKYNNDGTVKKKRNGTIEEVILKYCEYLVKQKDLMASLYELSDKVLGCWCVEKPIDYIRRDTVCHGEVLLKFVEIFEKWHDMSPAEYVKSVRELLEDVESHKLI